LGLASGQALNGHAVANYIAKYATKTSGRGLPSVQIRCEVDIADLRCPAHYRRLVTAAWQLGGTRHDVWFRAWAHMLGYGGHFLTKSRRYSVTFGQLRAVRADHRGQTGLVALDCLVTPSLQAGRGVTGPVQHRGQ